MTDDVKKPAETPVDIKEELANEPAPETVGPAGAAAATAVVHGVVAATEPEHLTPKDMPAAPEGMVAMHPAQVAVAVINEYLTAIIPQGVHPAQGAAYLLSGALSVLRGLGFTGKDVSDLVIQHSQTWRLMTETKGQKPN